MLRNTSKPHSFYCLEGLLITSVATLEWHLSRVSFFLFAFTSVLRAVHLRSDAFQYQQPDRRLAEKSVYSPVEAKLCKTLLFSFWVKLKPVELNETCLMPTFLPVEHKYPVFVWGLATNNNGVMEILAIFTSTWPLCCSLWVPSDYTPHLLNTVLINEDINKNLKVIHTRK